MSHYKLFNRQVRFDFRYLNPFLVEEDSAVRICGREAELLYSVKIKVVLFAPEIKLDFIVIYTTAPISFYYKARLVSLSTESSEKFLTSDSFGSSILDKRSFLSAVRQSKTLPVFSSAIAAGQTSKTKKQAAMNR